MLQREDWRENRQTRMKKQVLPVGTAQSLLMAAFP